MDVKKKPTLQIVTEPPFEVVHEKFKEVLEESAPPRKRGRPPTGKEVRSIRYPISFSPTQMKKIKIISKARGRFVAEWLAEILAPAIDAEWKKMVGKISIED